MFSDESIIAGEEACCRVRLPNEAYETAKAHRPERY
jgi:hypothetical protein